MLKSTLRLRSDRDRGRGEDAGTGGRATATPVIGTYLDMLDLSTAIVADDIVLEESGIDGFVLHEVVDCRARRIGAFGSAGDAWAAIDELDDARAGRR
jgi:hypothetical protein